MIHSELTFDENGHYAINKEVDNENQIDDESGERKGALRFFKTGTEIQIHPHYQFAVIKEHTRSEHTYQADPTGKISIPVNEGQLVQIVDDENLSKSLSKTPD